MVRAALAFLLVWSAALALAPRAHATEPIEVPFEDLNDPPSTTPPDPTGSPWRPILGPFASREQGFSELVAWDRGFAMAMSGRKGLLEIWRSPDGIHWRSVRAPFTTRDLAWTQLTATDDGLLLVQATGDRFKDLRLTFWRSPEARRWQRAGSLDLAVPPDLAPCMLNVEGAAPLGTGLVVVADICRSECCGSISPGVRVLAQAYPSVPGQGGVWTWSSPDGRRWTRTRTTGVGSGRLGWVQPAPDGLIARWTGADREALMRSTDAVRWERVSDLPSSVDPYGTFELRPLDDGYLLVGDTSEARDLRQGNFNVVWRAGRDGAWEQVLELPATSVTTSAVSGHTVLLVGYDQSFDEGPEFAWTRLSRDGGRTWEVSTGWPGMVDLCFGFVALREATAVATTGCLSRGVTAPSAWITRFDAVVAPSTEPTTDRPVLAPPLPGPAGRPPVLRTKRAPDAVAEEDGVRLELWVPRIPTASGAWLPATLRVTNTGTTPVVHNGSVDNLGCKNPTQTWLDTTGLFDPGKSWTGNAALIREQLLHIAGLGMGVYIPGSDSAGCLDFGVREALAPGASFTVPVATWPRYRFRDQPLPAGTAEVFARYRFARREGDAGAGDITVEVGAPVTIAGQHVIYPSPQQLVDAALAQPEVLAFVESRDLSSDWDAGLTDTGGVFAPRGHTFAELGYAGGLAPAETITIQVTTEPYAGGGMARVVIDPWDASVERVRLD